MLSRNPSKYEPVKSSDAQSKSKIWQNMSKDLVGQATALGNAIVDISAKLQPEV